MFDVLAGASMMLAGGGLAGSQIFRASPWGLGIVIGALLFAAGYVLVQDARHGGRGSAGFRL